MDPSLRTTRIVLDLRWDPELNDHPLAWDWATLLYMDPDRITIASTEDLDD